MATSRPEAPRRTGGYRLALAAGAAAAIGLLTGATGTIPVGPGKIPITWSAHSWVLDYKTQVIHLSGDVKVMRGDLSVAADEADAAKTGQDLKNSHWVFTGKVHVRTESQGDLHADRTTLEIVDGSLSSARVTGSPAQFEQTQSKNGSLAKGHANTVDYDVVAGTVKLTGEPWLSYANGQNIMNATSITYNVRNQQIQGEGDAGGGGAHMTITPKSDPPKTEAPSGTGARP